MGPLCRRHHNLKGHGLLHWSTTPPAPPAKTIVVEIYRDTAAMEYAG
ncbi:MAG: endonuclease [Aeromicrobium sp.]|nr:endonuclease [Aeromicrobium sp.]